MSRDSTNNGSGLSKEDALLALKVILKKIKSGEASPDQIAFAMDIDRALGGGFSSDIESAMREAEANKASRSAVAAPTEEKTDPVAKADKFFGSKEMQQVLSVHERIAKRQYVSDEELIQSKKTVLEKGPENAKLLAELEAERELRLRAIEARPQTLHQHKDRLQTLSDRIIYAKGVEIDRRITQRVMDETGKDIPAVVKDHRGVVTDELRREMEEIKNADKSKIDDRLSKATGKVPEREGASAGKGRRGGPPIPEHTTEYDMNPGASKSPSPTPGGKGTNREASRV